MLLLALGFLALFRGGDPEQAVISHMVHLHIHPDGRLPRSLIEAISHTTDARLWSIAAGATVYSAVHLAEAWGLWRGRPWAQWFALLSGATYLPWELAAFSAHRTATHALLLVANLAIVMYMLALRLQAGKARPYIVTSVQGWSRE